MEPIPFNLLGILAFVGATVYAVGDVLLLASKATVEDYPKLKPYAKLLSSAERMTALSPTRLMWGALIGVFMTPLILFGFWHAYQGLSGVNAWAGMAVFGLFGFATVIGAFVHGSFYYMGEYVHALNDVKEESQPVIAAMMERHRKILVITYAPLMVFVIAASILFSVLVASGKTAYPLWMAGVTPLTMTLVWLLVKRILPQFVRDWTEGAGFNIAYMAFFACITISLWK